MTTIIYKNEKKAKIYNILSSQDQGIYKKDELIMVIKTDDIFKFELNGPYCKTYAVERA